MRRLACLICSLLIASISHSPTRGALAAELAFRQLPTRRLSAVRTTAPPAVDGQLGDPAWNTAARVDRFVGFQGQPVSQRTEAFVCHDDAALYVAFRCFEAKMDRVVSAITARDGALWTEDCVEIFIDAPRDRQTYCQIEISPRGTVADKRCIWRDGKVTKDAQWTCEGLRVATSRRADQWCVEAAIPFSSLGAGINLRKAWGLNLTRSEQPHQELSSWASMSSTFHNPREFGVLAAVRSATFQDVAAAYPDRVTRALRARVHSGSQQSALSLVLDVTCDGKPCHSDKRRLSLKAGQSHEFIFRYPIPGRQQYDAKLALLDATTGKQLDVVDDSVPRQYFAPSSAFATPHTRWAKPLAGGPLRVLFLTPYFTQRDIVELSQRLSLDARVVSFLTSQWDLPERPSPEEYLELVRRELADDLDAIVIDRPFLQPARRTGSERYSGASLAADIIESIEQRVAAGTGLILFSRGDLPPSWQGDTMKPCRGHSVSRGKLAVVRPHFVSAGMPVDAFAGLTLGVYDSENAAILRVGSSTFLSEAVHGKGRVLIFGHTRNGIVPPAERRPTHSHWDYYHAFFARALVWASQRESSLRLQSLSVEPDAFMRGDGTRAKAVLSLQNLGEAVTVKATFRFRDPYSRALATNAVSVDLPQRGVATCQAAAPAGLADGLHFADVIVTAGGNAVEWGSATFRVRSPARVDEVLTESAVLRAGQPIRGKVTIGGGRGPTTAAYAKGDGEARRTGAVEFVAGRVGKALLPGAGALEYAREGNLNGAEGTVEFWVALGEPKPGPTGRLTNWWWRTPHALRLIHYAERKALYFQVRPTPGSAQGGAALGFSTADWQRDEWRHVVCTWGQEGLAAYVDGEPVAKSKPMSTEIVVQGPLRLGHVDKYGLAMDRIDEFCVYGRALTQQEIAARSESTSAPSHEALLLYLPFDAPEAAAPGASRLRLRLVDRLGRRVGEQWIQISPDAKEPIPFSFAYPRPLARSARVEAALFDETGIADHAESPWVELAERRLDDFLYFCWDWGYSARHPDYIRDTLCRRLAEQGVDGVDGRSSLDFKLLSGAPFPAGKRHAAHGKAWYDVFQELKSGYARTRDKKYLVRQPCLSDPATWRDYRKSVAAALRPRMAHQPIAYGLGDENTITFESSPLDLCFSRHCLRELRLWLRGQYGTLEALNASWQTEFASWGQVMPMTAEEVRGRGSYAPWCDHRAFMAHVFAQAHARAADAIHAVDPGARLSTSGTRPAFPYSACDWWQILPHLDHLMPYSLWYDQGEVHRSFSALPQMMCSGFGAKGPYQKYLIWYAALHGSTSLVFSKVSSCIAADLSVHPDQPVRTAEMRDLQQGSGKALMRAERQHDGIAVHYSPASVRVQWITSFEDGKRLGYESPAARDRRGWLRLMEALGLQYNSVSYEQIESGELLARGYKALLMPYSQAVSRKEAAAIRAFVERGGTLIADYRVATFDEHGVPQKPGLLDDVFGIARQDQRPQYVEGEASLAASGTIRDITGGPGLTVQGAEVLAEFGKGKTWPAICVKNLGRGRAYYLNFLYDFRATYSDPTEQALDPTLCGWARHAFAQAGVAPCVRVEAKAAASGQYEIVRFRRGAAEYVCLLRQWQVANSSDRAQLEVALDRKAHVCEVRTGKRYGLCDRVKTEIGLGEARVFALLPYEVKSVHVAGPTSVLPGGLIRFQARVDAGASQPDEHILHVEVIGPDGKARRHYARNLVAARGVAEREITFALNDPAGAWKLAVRDVVSGCTGELTFHLVEQAQARRARIDMRSAWDLTGIVEEMRNLGVSIPRRVEELEWKVCREINLQRVHESHEQAEDVAEMKEILSSLCLPAACPAQYPGRRSALAAVAPAQPGLPVLQARGFIEDRVLGVGLKSYPYVIDWNGDGRQDLLVGDHDGFIYIYLNEGTPSEPKFGRATRLKSCSSGEDFIIHFNPKLDFADLVGDSKPDLVVGSHAGRAVLFENVAKEPELFAFDLAKYIELQSRGGVIDVGNYGYPELADWDGDGALDLLMGEEEGGLYFFKGMGRKAAPRFHAGRRVPGFAGDMYPCPEIIDWDNDGRLDVVLGGRDGTVRLFMNEGSAQRPRYGRWRRLTDIAGRTIDVGRLSHPHVADWNRDGSRDLLLGNDDGDVLVWRNVGSDAWPLFDGFERLRDAGGELVCGVHPVIDVVDWNRDGKLDLLAGGETERVRLYLNTGTRQEPRFDAFTFLPGVEYTGDALCPALSPARELWDNRALEFTTEYVGNLAPDAVDWNEDGKLDLVLGGYTGLVYLFLNEGSADAPRFAAGQPLTAAGALLRVAGFSTPVVVDWNHDGKKDLVCGDFLGRVHVFANVGEHAAPAFGSDERLKVGGQEFAFGPRAIVDVADYDGDGRLDVLVGNRLGKVVALLNVGSKEQPRFDRAEHLRDESGVWRELYAGAWASPRGRSMPLYHRRDGGVAALDAVATSCPRVVDWDGDGQRELVVSHRFGRVFVFSQKR